MSNLSNFYDTLKSRLAVIYPQNSGYYLLSRPFEVEKNDELKLNKGYGLVMGPGAPANNREIGCNVEVVRQITIVNTRHAPALELDRDKKFSAEKSLLEDQLLILKEFETNFGAYYSAGNLVADINYDSDNGIELVFPTREDFIVIRTTFRFRYKEAL
jgi:hypothetical protein